VRSLAPGAPRSERDTVDLTWLIIPLAVGVFTLRTILIGRRLKIAASNPTLTDVRAFREAKQNLQAHRKELDAAVASPKAHLASAKRLSRLSPPRSRTPGSTLDRMVEDFLPERRL